MKGLWKHKKEFKTSTDKEKVRNSETTAVETERRKRSGKRRKKKK